MVPRFLQHPKSEVTVLDHLELEEDVNNLPHLTLLKSYTAIMLLDGSQPKYPVGKIPKKIWRRHSRHNHTHRSTSKGMGQCSDWCYYCINRIQTFQKPGKSRFLGFMQEHTEQQELAEIYQLLCLMLNESINSPTIFAYCFKVISKIVNDVKPQQPSVITTDQPVYAIVVMMDPLLNELYFLNAICY